MLIRIPLVYLLLHIKAWSGGSQFYLGKVLLLLGLKSLSLFGCLPKAHQQHSCSQGIQRTGMPHLQVPSVEMFLGYEFHLPYNICRGPPVGFVYRYHNPLRIVVNILQQWRKVILVNCIKSIHLPICKQFSPLSSDVFHPQTPLQSKPSQSPVPSQRI